MRATLTSAALLTVVLVVLPAPPGDAASSARTNGQIAYDRANPLSPDDTFVYTANPDGGGARRLMARHTCCPSWSHDGRTLAIPAGLPGDRLTTATVDADGRSYKRLPIKDPTLSVACAGGAWSPDDAPRWSPDGRKVVFAANSATASNIYVANADGTGLVQVTHDGHSDSPSWGTRPLSS